jgi:hypothetical protein
LVIAAIAIHPVVAVGALIPTYLAPITKTAEPFIGVTYYQIFQPAGFPTPGILPRELAIHIVEIDPSAPGVSFLGTPGNGDVAEEYTRRTTSNFVATNGLSVGINGDFYSTDTGSNASVSGLGMSNGVTVSPAASGSSSLITFQDNRARITSSTTVPAGAWNAVSGNQRILRNGVISAPDNSYTTTLNPHTAVGVDSDNGHVFFMVVDGRQNEYSEGMRTDEMAQMLLDFGVDNAINLDGGGSSTLVFADGLRGGARTVNSPSDGSSSQAPGSERSVANHFGVKATKNPNYVPLPSPPRPLPPTAEYVINSLTILDDFENGEGRFSSAPFGSSGSTTGITNASTAIPITGDAQQGQGSQLITMVRDSTSSARLRHLSAGGVPAGNRAVIDGLPSAMSKSGYVGFFLKTFDELLQVSIGIDDGNSLSNGLERSSVMPVIADGKWHLYEWNLADANMWSNFANGNGEIGGPYAYIDSIFFFSTAAPGETVSVMLDTVAYNPAGSLAALAVPEPVFASQIGMLLLAAICLQRRSLNRNGDCYYLR